MSVDNPMLDLVESYGADGKHLSGSFNFYPQRYTGMPLEAFQRAAARYRAHHLRSAAFITAPSGARFALAGLRGATAPSRCIATCPLGCRRAISRC